MESATVHTAAGTTGWSVRMLHYLDAAGLVRPPRSPSGYRLYGEREIAHLRELRQLLADHDLRPADLQVALRLRSEPALRHAVDEWLDVSAASEATASETTATETTAVTENKSGTAADMEGASDPKSPRATHKHPTGSDPSTSWLRFEQDKHSRALLSHNKT